MRIGSPRDVLIISKNTKMIIALMENFIKTKYEHLDGYDRVEHIGFWRYLIVRESKRTRQTMIIVVCNTKGVEE